MSQDPSSDATPPHAVLPSLATPPASLLLPALDHDQHEQSQAQAAALTAWPAIERLLADNNTNEAFTALESLARELRILTNHDPAPWRPTLTQCRAIVYDNIAYTATIHGEWQAAHASLARCRAWDTELSAHIDTLLQALTGANGLVP